MSWTHPLCLRCWQAEHGDRPPVRVKDDGEARCCECGAATSEGIYVRRDPALVRYQREDE